MQNRNLYHPPKKTGQRLYFIAFMAFLLMACAETKPLERCTDEFTPINIDTAVQP